MNISKTEIIDTISILGSGWLGMSLAGFLKKDGYQVNVSYRSIATFNSIKHIGCSPYKIDLCKRDWDLNFFKSSCIIIAITHKISDDYAYLIDTLSKTSIKYVIFVSSSSVYINDAKHLTENAPLKKDHPLVSIENLFSNATWVETCILRFSGLFGYSRHPGNFFQNRLIPNSMGRVNMIHRDDCIGIIQRVLKKQAFPSLFNACSDKHPTRMAFYSKAYQVLGLAPPLFDDIKTNTGKIIVNDHLRTTLNYTFKYPNPLDALDIQANHQ